MAGENRETVRFLLEQAQKLRALAMPHIPGISEELLALAEALENRARELGGDN